MYCRFDSSFIYRHLNSLYSVQVPRCGRDATIDDCIKPIACHQDVMIVVVVLGVWKLISTYDEIAF